MQTVEIEPHIKLMEEDIRIADSDVGTKPLVVVQVELTKFVIEQLKA
jgi:hypothetical protein